MKRLALFVAPFLVSACINDVYGMKPEVKIDPAKKIVAPTVLSLEDPDRGDAWSIKSGDTVHIRLEANPTTGIWWSDPVFDNSILALSSSDYVADPAPEGLVGSGGTTVMTFKAIAAGSSKITSEYSRGGGTVYDTLDITIEVTE